MKKMRRLLLTAFLLLTSTTTWAGEITVQDQAGRKVVIQQPVERVITTFIPATICAMSAGLKDKLVGASSKDETSSIYEVLINKENPPILVGNRTVGLNLETISSLQPDLVIMYGQKDGVRTAERLTALGFPAIIIKPETLLDMQKSMELIGLAAGQEAHTNKVVAAMSKIEKKVTAHVKGKGMPSVYYATSDLLRTVSGDMLQNEMIGLAGGRNVSEQTKGFFVNISKEQLSAWNPEIIICSDRLAPKELDRINLAEFVDISARKTKRIYRIPEDTYWDFPSPLAMAGVLWMSNRVHPEVYSEREVEKEIAQFYDTLFGDGFAEKYPKVIGKEM